MSLSSSRSEVETDIYDPFRTTKYVNNAYHVTIKMEEIKKKMELDRRSMLFGSTGNEGKAMGA
jgi:hypothetical protein